MKNTITHYVNQCFCNQLDCWPVAWLICVAMVLLFQPVFGQTSDSQTQSGPVIPAKFEASSQTNSDSASVELPVNIKIQLAGAKDIAELIRTNEGYRYRIYFDDGHVELLTADQFAQRVFRNQTSRGWLAIVLNISSTWGIVWVVVGLMGQVLFTGRMVVQWLISEREKRSVVPPIFWWMSLGGATMLIIYFIWRKDIIGVLGQATGWFIYVRNLRMIYRPACAASPTSQD